MVKTLFFLWCFITSAVLCAQPGTEIYLFDLKHQRGQIVLSDPKNITNRKGYDNQPFFHPDKPLLYFVSANNEGRTDIIEYAYRTGQERKFTQTHDREYSPTVTPDKQFISCILQRDSGEQHLVKYPVEGGEPQIIIENYVVGYHAWADNNTVVVFTLPQPFTLRMIRPTDGTTSSIADSIGRSLHRIPGTNTISFLQKMTDSGWDVCRFDPQTKSISQIAKGLPGDEHHMAWMPDGTMLMSENNNLFFFTPGEHGAWKRAEIKYKGSLPPITRIAVSPDGRTAAVVLNEPAPLNDKQN